MSKNIFKDYIDACELVKELEEKIREIERENTVHDVVSGSSSEFPYLGKHFHIEGVDPQVNTNYEWEQLRQQKDEAEQLSRQADALMAKASLRLQRIIRYKYFEKLSWNQVADKMGRGATEDSIKKEFQRFMKSN